MENISKILIVDDDEDILELLSFNLKNNGFVVESANNGSLAIQKAREFSPDLILLDIMMPEMDGVEACGEIRKIDKLKSTIIIFLTARGEDYSQLAGYRAGADDYITKPIKPKLLIAKLNAILNMKRRENSLPPLKSN
ncbi:MAG: response regulator, partial [Bacteroidales bacterium]|nr:response regulator [Bacteroidales bacterium]